jgi:DNA-binding transcriptional LysR family regulator
MSLTPAGQRLVPIASQMVNLGADAAGAIRQAQGASEQLRVAATSTVTEFVAPPLLAAFTTRVPSVEASVGVSSPHEMTALLQERLADACFGPRLGATGSAGLESEPMMRYRLMVVASPEHHLAGAHDIPWGKLSDEDWLVDPSGADRSAEVGLLIERLQVPPASVRVFPSQAAAWSAAAEGEGVAPAIGHLVSRDIDRGRLVRLDVRSTPIELLWYVSTLTADRRPPAASALRRFLKTTEAMQSMYRSDGGVPASRFRPPVYVTLWS